MHLAGKWVPVFFCWVISTQWTQLLRKQLFFLNRCHVRQAGLRSYGKDLGTSTAAERIICPLHEKIHLPYVASETYLGLDTAPASGELLTPTYWSSCQSSNMPRRLLPQGLCTCHCLCLEHRYPHGSLLHFLQVIARRMCSPHPGLS